MQFERCGSVIRHLNLKREFLRAGDARHREIRPVLVVLSGIFRGVYSAGSLLALHKMGFGEAFDHAVSVSTGTPAVAYFLAGEPARGITIYWEECLSGKFIPIHLLDGAKALLSQFGIKRFGESHLMDIEYLCRVFRGEEGNKPLDIEALKRSRTRWHVVVVRCRDGEGILLDATRLSDPVEAIRASIAVPGVSNGRVAIDNELYEDGVGAMPCDLEYVVNELDPTDILVLANRAEDDGNHAVEQLLTKMALADQIERIKDDYATREERFRKGIDFLRTKWRGRYGIVWTGDEVKAIETNAEVLKKAAADAEAWTTKLIASELK